MQQRFEYKYLPKKSYYSFENFFDHYRIKTQNEEVKINNIYFDTPDNYFYFQHIDGVMDRIKIRIRWYEESNYFKNKFFLEIKRKINHISKKYRVELKDFNINNLNHFNIIQFYPIIFKDDFINFKYLNYVKPKLFNSYNRSYFYVDQNQEHRITYDYNLNFSKINDFFKMYYHYKSNMRLIEHKYLSRLDNTHKLFNNTLYKTNFSKYIYGVSKLYKNIAI